MGCCQSSLDDSEERRPILSGSGPTPTGSSGAVEQPSNPLLSPVPPKSDEQAKLHHILQVTTQSIINVAADSQTIEQDEYRNTSKQYSQKILRGGLRFGKPYRLPSVQTAPVQAILAMPPPPPEDLVAVIAAADKCQQYKSKIAVVHKEELVVPFGVP